MKSVPQWLAIAWMLFAICAIHAGESIVHQDDFSNDLSQWHAELEQGGKVAIQDGKLVIDVPRGATIWFKHELQGPVVIQYDATIISAGGPNDRVSDLNCFWMASDPRAEKDDFFAVKRSGAFRDYHQLRCYYVGLGGNNNSTTRFRRYIGHPQNRPLMPEHDRREPKFMIEPNRTYRIELVADGQRIQYRRDGRAIFDLTDDQPYTRGYFALRTVQNHMHIDNFKVSAIRYDASSTPDLMQRAIAYADVMLADGRGRWGERKTPLFASMLDRNTHDLLQESQVPDLDAFGIRFGDRAYGAANVAHDAELYELLYQLGEITGESRYSEAADAALKWFLLNGQHPQTGLLAWGEHLGWDLQNDRVHYPRGIKYHEFAGPLDLWDRFYALAPDATLRYAMALWEHGITDHENMQWSRHTRYETGAFEVGREFPRYYGHFARAWSHAMAHSDDQSYKATLYIALDRLLDAALSRCHPRHGALPAGLSPRSREAYWMGNNLWMMYDLHHAIPHLPDELAAKAKLLIQRADEVIFKLAHDLKPDGRGFVKLARYETLDAQDTRPDPIDPHTPMWAAGYGMPTTSDIANRMIARYEQSGDERYRQLALAAARMYLHSDPGTSINLHPQALAAAIDLMRQAYELSGEPVLLERAEYFAQRAVELFLDEASPLPRVLSQQHHHYESISGGPALMLSLLKLQQTMTANEHR